ncbi:glycoside hydrolase family 43 [Fusarium mundagurra]|uniref:Glycoside hydrolase family 43 n=1 Tax=Fusarium mundagurra TaxID=1567541 RepID=A0A8H5YSG6_9HYPO|nr:glycoside hydrolase family 43 [Fusarium mundagurra]
MRWNLLQLVATAALALTASANTVLPRQQKFVGYLITTFSDPVPKVQQYLSNGNNPLSYRKLNNGNPILASTCSLRILYYCYWTNWPSDLDINAPGFSWDKATRHGSRGLVIWQSKDLVNWSGPKLRTVEASTAGMTWAPSAVWDDVTSQYYVFWASRHYAFNDPGHVGFAGLDKIRYATTKDFVTFSAPKDYYAPGIPVIDQEFQYLGTPGHFVRYIKDERTNQVFQERTAGGLFGTWTRNPGFVRNESPREGPLSFRDNNNPDLYHLWMDDYVQSLPFQTTNILKPGIFAQSNAAGFPHGLKHGVVTPLTQAEYKRLQAKYP